MDVFLLIGLPLISVFLYVITITIIKKVIKGEESTNHLIVGAIFFAIIIFGIVFLVKTSSWQ